MNARTTNSTQQVVAEFDAQVAISIRPNGEPWTEETLAAAFAKQGVIRRIDGAWILPDGDGAALFSVLAAPLSPPPAARLMLIMDVPCVAPDKKAFELMVTCARGLAAELDGTIIDDGNQPLSDAALMQIADQVAAFHERMEKSGLVPGSTLARRLLARDAGDMASPACGKELLQ